MSQVWKYGFQPTKSGALLGLGTLILAWQQFLISAFIVGCIALNENLGKPLPLRWTMLTFGLSMLVRPVKHVGDGREQRCFDYVKAKLEKSPPAGDRIQRILDEIDEYARFESFLMNVGDEKGLILDNSIKNTKPKIIMELGCYVGYSTLRMARASDADCHIYTVEWSPVNAGVARQFFELAGVSHKITVVEGYIGDGGKTVETLQTQYGLTGKVDFLFVDHTKEAYLPDLKTILDRKFLHPGSVVVADNVGFPGIPDYKKFMEDQEGKLFRTKFHHTHIEYFIMKDLMLESTLLV